MPGLTIRRARAWAAVLAITVFAPWLGGCTGNKPEPDANLFPADYKQELAAFMRTYLDNPRKVRDAHVGTPALKPVAGTPRYVTCVRYNPQDSENRYEGNKENVAIFLAGRVNQFLPSDPQICAGLAYQRYPEIESMVP